MNRRRFSLQLHTQLNAPSSLGHENHQNSNGKAPQGMAERTEKKKPAPARAAVKDVALSVADIKELFTLMKQNEIAELDLEQHGTKIHIVSTHAPVVAHAAMPQMVPMMHGVQPVVSVPPQPSAAPAEVPSPAAAAPPAAEVPSNLKTILSPMVGTFYRAPSPDADAFVNVGDRVKEDTTLCIVEAMKLMNEIKADTRGKIVKVLVENAHPVEYNQPLFLVEPE
jgi:acetyl-CoA carboxylase biotin carboxyl carrier protein